jgi:hypothetical protein
MKSFPGKASLVKLSLGRASTALEEGSGSTAMEWLNQVPEDKRPSGFEAEINYQLSKEAASRGEWDVFEKLLTSANRQTPTPLYQKRLELARRRKPLLIITNGSHGPKHRSWASASRSPRIVRSAGPDPRD